MSEYVELYIDQGSTFSNIINITDDITNLPINITGYVVTCQIRKSYYSSNISANINCSLSNVTNGEITMTLDAANTSNLKPGRYVFDVKTKDTGNYINRVLEGTITITPQVTR